MAKRKRTEAANRTVEEWLREINRLEEQLKEDEENVRLVEEARDKTDNELDWAYRQAAKLFAPGAVLKEGYWCFSLDSSEPERLNRFLPSK